MTTTDKIQHIAEWWWAQRGVCLTTLSPEGIEEWSKVDSLWDTAKKLSEEYNKIAQGPISVERMMMVIEPMNKMRKALADLDEQQLMEAIYDAIVYLEIYNKEK